MKKLLTLIILFVGLNQSYGQTLTYDDFKSLIPYLKTEDWKSAFKESSKLLTAEKDTSDFHAIILYINIFSAAGMVTENQMSYKELEQNVMKFQGQKIIMPAHPVTTKDGALSQLKFEVTDSTNTAFTSAANSTGTNILCFEKFIFKDKVNLDDFTEKSIVRCGGTLEKIETNPNKSLIWILRLTVKDAFARKAN
ncbi:hypothetical protein EZ428_15955 [Pedobacter frigiditerrae]|uniref:Uncharacterized protein n=1 Tax=Pedobacter frigiditerrae TaxID=2530452 RepID=A0A4R0MQQ5_9SPHI|nr:hypothetical protein [Pedobacter frigiditerrae]TCC89195.1 hypothetical protein EZ428_15955 [Pedobacter frigiditerrae]